VPDSTQDASSSPVLEIAHVLFMDIVAYSKLPMEDQTRLLGELREIVRHTSEFGRGSGQRLSLPTGDGMALVFFGDAEAAARCALEIARALRDRPELKLRMGINAGPVHQVEDINAQRNVAGSGINMAQRVMDCGDAGHILVTQSVAEVLGNMSSWSAKLHDLGQAEVKHGVKIHVYNLCTQDAGNPQLPQKMQTVRRRAQARKFVLAGTLAGVIAVVALGGLLFSRNRHQPKLTDRDTIVLADFDNKTGDNVFDDTLKTALTISLRQSPFLNLLSDSRVSKTLQLMTRPAGTKLTPEVARELCQRAGSKAYVTGSISSLGSEYVLQLKAVNCQSGDALSQEQITVASKERVLNALGEAAAKLREKLGESLATVQKFDIPLVEATTSSLEALKAYSLARKTYNEKGGVAALPYGQRAIELDPNFALGYRTVGSDYFGLGELARASEYYTKAFELRDHTSDREKLEIIADYYSHVTGELDKSAKTLQEEIESYPRELAPYINGGLVYAEQGEFEKAVETTRQGMSLGPDQVDAYINLANYDLALQRLDDARQMIRGAEVRGLDDAILHESLYAIAFLGSDSAAMAEQQLWFADKPEYANWGLALSSDTEAYRGHLGKAREETKRAVDLAIQADGKEDGAIWQAIGAQRAAVYGYPAEAQEEAADALKLDPASLGVESEVAIAFALAGDTARAASLVQNLGKGFPLDTQMQLLWLPTIKAQLALDQENTAAALSDLQAASAIEFGQIQFVANISCLYPTYVRGQAYLAAGQGGAAALEFQKILDHSGIVWNCWTGALAHLGVARANALEAKTARATDAGAARTRALAAYKDFLTLWKDADPDIPILKEAKAEYGRLQ
jgi:eukaryotic-like serine/threonine-protein kinase